MPAGPHDPSFVRYFLPRQIILHLVHPNSLSSDDIADQVEAAPSPLGLAAGVFVRPDPSRILRFDLPGDNEETLSIAPTEVDLNDDDLMNLLGTIFGTTGGQPVNLQGPPNTISLRGAAPNWLLSGASHQIGTGGPGAWPAPAPDPGNAWRFVTPNGTSLDGLGSELGEGWDVAILDTAPALESLQRARAQWPEHALLNGLWGPNGRLRVYPSPDTDLAQALEEYSCQNHRYLMPDHGLFVAGVVHSIAPLATLHLYEVLNPYGVGCVETVARGLARVLGLRANVRRLVVNCSFVLNPPPDGLVDEQYPFDTSQPGLISYMCGSLDELFNLFGPSEIPTVIASAGNDGTNTRPLPRYPAAFGSVAGVGALNVQIGTNVSNYVEASYSNVSEAPAANGYMAFGGEPGPGNGVRGVYISAFPNHGGAQGSLPNHMPTLDEIYYTGNQTGWAWWAGSSFAAPIVTGLIAAQSIDNPLLLAGQNSAVVGNSGDLTTQGEKVIAVRQQ